MIIIVHQMAYLVALVEELHDSALVDMLKGQASGLVDGD
jgi:hypothetical protein